MLRPENTTILSEATGQTSTDDLGWGQLLPIQTHVVPGHHFTMMTGENAIAIAGHIDRLLRESQNSNANLASNAGDQASMEVRK